MRTPLIAGNWKMNGSIGLIEHFAGRLTSSALPAGIEVALMVSFPYLNVARHAFADTPVNVGAQTLNPAPSGAHTGEVSGAMLAEVGAHYVLVGHSERRQLYQETDLDIKARVSAALDAGLLPVLCVGETLDERDQERTMEVVLGQVSQVVEPLGTQERSQLVIAYEPVWAIGTGRTATPEQAQDTMKAIRAYLSGLDPLLGEQMRLLYGGSMNAGNASELLAQPDIDGGLVGGASLKIDDFYAICQSAG